MKRIAGLLIACLLLTAALAGCATADEGKSSPEPSDDESVKATGEAAGGQSEDDPYPALEPETDGEREALALAESNEGRKWASGDFQNGTPVEGDARLVGYTFRINDGTTQYQVRVMNGKVYGYVGNASDKALAGEYSAGVYTDASPATDRQSEAWETALAEVAKVNGNATEGGIESYIFFFPTKEDAQIPEVLVFADAGYRTAYSANFATGGSWFE